MPALIVQSNQALADLWIRHLRRLGCEADLALTETLAFEHLRRREYKAIVVDLVLSDGSAFAVSDYASYRQPEAKVIFVTNTRFFSDGSIFRHCANACAFLPTATPPSDLATMVQHYATA